MRKFSIFQPPDENTELKESSTFKQQNMVEFIESIVKYKRNNFIYLGT
jgi:hypothetical protein